MSLPRHLQFLQDLADSQPGPLGRYFPDTESGSLLRREHEGDFEVDGITYVGPLDGTMVPIEAENAEPMEENIWDAQKFSSLVHAIESGDDPHVDPGYADLWLESGELMAQVRDGNHRTFAPIAAGSSWTWVLMSDSTRQDIDQGVPGSDKLYRAIRSAQKSAGVPLFKRRRQSVASGSKREHLLEEERLNARLRAQLDDHYRTMLDTYGPVESGPEEWEQRQRPQLFWRMRVGELAEEFGPDWVDTNIFESEEGENANRLHELLSESGRSLASAREAAGLAHGERLDPDTGKVTRGPTRTSNPLGNLPSKASRMWEKVYASAQERGLSQGAAAAQAWCTVKRSYYKEGGRWLRRKNRLRTDQQPPGCRPSSEFTSNPKSSVESESIALDLLENSITAAADILANPESVRSIKKRLLR